MSSFEYRRAIYGDFIRGKLDFHYEKVLGSRPEIITKDCAGFWFFYKAHPPMHIGICVGGCNAVDEPKDKHDV
jgi:hypothetical protein